MKVSKNAYMGQYSCKYLVWALGQLSQTDALFSPWVATLSHTQSSGYVPPLRHPRLKPKESRDPVINLCCQYTDCHRSICTFSAFHSILQSGSSQMNLHSHCLTPRILMLIWKKRMLLTLGMILMVSRNLLNATCGLKNTLQKDLPNF